MRIPSVGVVDGEQLAMAAHLGIDAEHDSMEMAGLHP